MFDDESSGDCESVCTDDDDMDHSMQHKSARTARPQSLGARIAARRQREADFTLQEEDDDGDDSTSMLPEGLHQALSEMSKAFAEVSCRVVTAVTPAHKARLLRCSFAARAGR